MAILPELGVGATYIAALEPLLRDEEGLIQVVEIEPQTLWYPTGPSRQGSLRMDEALYQKVLALGQPKLLHGIGFPVGGTIPPSRSQIPLLRRMLRELQVPWMSEHLSFTEIPRTPGPLRAGFLLPPRQSAQGVRAAIASIRAMTSDLAIPLAVETGVNYLQPRKDELPDGEFVAAVAEEADCGILLDLHNLWTNERNGRQRVGEFVRQLPLERVWEVHIAGGSERDGYWLDSHSDVVPEELLSVARDVLPELPNLRALIYEVFPVYAKQIGVERIARQLGALRDTWENCRGKVQGITRSSVRHDNLAQRPTPEEWESVLGSLVIGHAASGTLADELRQDPGLEVIKGLLADFRASMVVATFRLSSRLLMLQLGGEGFRQLLTRFWDRKTPSQFSAGEGLNFAEFVDDQALDTPFLKEVLGFERAVVKTLTEDCVHEAEFAHDPLVVIRALAEGRMPEDPAVGTFKVRLTPDSRDVLEGSEAVRLPGVFH